MKRRYYSDFYRQQHKVRRLRSLRNWLGLFTKLALCALAAEAACFVLTSPRLAVKQVTVKGARADVLAHSQAVMIDALGRNIVRAPVSSLADRLKSHPVVKSVEVHRGFPDRLIAVVREREAVLNVVWNGAYYLLDDTNTPFRKMKRASAGCPVVDASPSKPPELGKPWKSSYLETAITCLKEAEKQGLDVRAVSIDPVGDMCLNIRNAVRIRAGSPQDIDKKLMVASRFLASPPAPLKSLDYIDVSCLSAPVFRPKGAQAALPVP